MTTITARARQIIEACDCDPVFTRREAISLAAALPRNMAPQDCECYYIDTRPALVLPGWHADDGNQEMEYPDASSGREAAQEYVDGGDWGDDGGSVDVAAWRVAIVLDILGDAQEQRYDEGSYSIEIEPNHDALIRHTVGRYDLHRLCGTDPDAHTWTRDGEGGCDSNPGVWSLGGTRMHFASHCRACGLKRSVIDPGSQRNPGEGTRYTYEMADDEQIELWRASGAMDASSYA